MNEKQYVFTIDDRITIVVQANNMSNAVQYLKDLGVNMNKIST